MFVICRKFKLLDSCGIPYDANILFYNNVFCEFEKADAHTVKCQEWYPDYNFCVVEMVVI